MQVYHPNIDEVSGTVCLDVINQAWTALYDLSNIFESFLPQLLTYPNPTDPLNGDAAALYLHRPEEYKKKVSEYVKKYASEEALRQSEQSAANVSSSDESSMSEFSEDEAQVRSKHFYGSGKKNKALKKEQIWQLLGCIADSQTDPGTGWGWWFGSGLG